MQEDTIYFINLVFYADEGSVSFHAPCIDARMVSFLYGLGSSSYIIAM